MAVHHFSGVTFARSSQVSVGRHIALTRAIALAPTTRGSARAPSCPGEPIAGNWGPERALSTSTVGERKTRGLHSNVFTRDSIVLYVREYQYPLQEGRSYMKYFNQIFYFTGYLLRNWILTSSQPHSQPEFE